MTPTATKINIPFNRPFVDGRVWEYIKEVVDRGKLSGDGPMCRSVEEQLRNLFSIKHALLTSSCTHGLEMATMVLNLGPGDEVIIPSFTFVSTANAILRGRGKPVFCEINERTATIDVEDLERRITKKTRAVIVVHYAGVAAEMDEICALARRHNIVVIEDAAQGVNAKYKGKFLGTIGDIGCFRPGELPPADPDELDACFCIGASMSVAYGLTLTQQSATARQTVSVLSESTFLHSGLPALANIVRNEGDATVCQDGWRLSHSYGLWVVSFHEIISS